MAKQPFPTPTDANYINRLRKDYPETCAGQDDEWIMNYYNPSGFKYVECTLWDHFGDAASDFERLADAYLELLRSSQGKSSQEGK